MNDAPQPDHPKHRHGWAKISWLAGGAALIFFGLILLPTVAMTAVGAGLIAAGVVMLVVGTLRFLRSASGRYVKSKYVR